MGISSYVKLAIFLLLIMIDMKLSVSLREKKEVGYWFVLMLTNIRCLRMAFFQISISEFTFLGVRTATRMSITRTRRADALLAYLFVLFMGVVLSLEFITYCRLTFNEGSYTILKVIKERKKGIIDGKAIRNRKRLPNTLKNTRTVDTPRTILLHSVDLARLTFLCGDVDFENGSRTLKVINAFFIAKVSLTQMALATS